MEPEPLEVTLEFARRHCGNLVEEMLQSMAGAFALTSHSNRDVRVAALGICYFHWKCGASEEFVRICLDVVRSDIDSEVRRTGISLISMALSGTAHDGARRTFCGVVSNNHDDPMIRWLAYEGLWRIECGSAAPIDSENITFRLCQRRGLPPPLELINWTFVKASASSGTALTAR
jgi:hypothetical protein